MRRKQKYYHSHPEFKQGSYSTKTSLSSFSGRKRIQYLYNLFWYTGSITSDRLLKMGLGLLTDKAKTKLVKTLIKKSENSDCCNIVERYIDGRDDEIECIEDFHRNTKYRKTIFSTVYTAVENKYHRVENIKTIPWQQKRLDQIREFFGLTEVDMEIITLLYLYEIDSGTERLYDALGEFLLIRNSYMDPKTQKKLISLLCGLKTSEVTEAISYSGSLVRTGILNKDLTLAEEVIPYIEGYNQKPFADTYFQEFNSNTIPLKDHQIKDTHLEILKNLIECRKGQQPVNILLYGLPGTGKTEFARSLGKHFKYRVFEIKNFTEDDNKKENLNEFRQRAFLACQRLIDSQRAIILVDEADSLLNSRPAFFSFSPIAEKGQINILLDQSQAISIWITNRSDGIDDSTFRRFDYSIKFEKFCFEQRKKIWNNAMRKHGVKQCFSEGDIDNLATDYEVSAGGIDVALRNAARFFKKKGSKKKLVIQIKEILDAHLQVMNQGNGPKCTSKAGTRHYSLEGLNIKGGLDQSLQILDEFNSYWEHSNDESEINNMNILLYGPPGTGKTEFAKYISRRLKRKLIIKRASDLLNMYVGMTEKTICESFEQAQRERAVLFIDEADSMLGSREGAVRSWEITQVNELLTNMESFKGILICSTNFKKYIDSAAIRRFNLKLEFDYLRPAGVYTFYKNLLGSLTDNPLSENEMNSLCSIPCLTPGDFKCVYQKYVFMKKTGISHQNLITALRFEVESKHGNVGKKIGFGKW